MARLGGTVGRGWARSCHRRGPVASGAKIRAGQGASWRGPRRAAPAGRGESNRLDGRQLHAIGGGGGELDPAAAALGPPDLVGRLAGKLDRELAVCLRAGHLDHGPRIDASRAGGQQLDHNIHATLQLAASG
jgi:hypothetical protein